MEAINVDRKPNKRKIVAGPEAIDVFNTLSFKDGERDNLSAVIRKFDQYCTPRVNEKYERYVFRARLQHEDETTEQHASHCN